MKQLLHLTHLVRSECSILGFGQVAKSKKVNSDKLMMFHSTIFLAHSISGYGLALANCARTDLVTDLTRLMAEFGDYVKDGIDLMIENCWLERIPEAANRKELRTTNN